jgi:sugar phosphate isomerase/epimerase
VVLPACAAISRHDPGNIYFYSDGRLDPVQDAATVDGLVTGMSVKDYEHPKRADLTPGTGQVEFSALMARLRQGGFTRGPLIVETLAAGDRTQTLQEARKALRFVSDLISRRKT